MTQQDTEIKKLSRFITSLTPPNHIILFYDNPLDIEALKDETEAKEYDELEARKSLRDETAQSTDFISPLLVRKVDEQLNDLDTLLREERRINNREQGDSIICTYDLGKFMELNEEPRMEILSLHDHILFTKFTNGGMALIEATENALNNALGTHGADIIQRYIEQETGDREITPLSFRGYLDTMSGLLGSGAVPLTRLIYRRLFQMMRSSRECE